MKTLPEVPITWKISEGDKAYNSKQIFVINVWAVKDETRSVYEPSTKVTEILITFPILWLGIYGSVGPIILKGGHLDELYFDGWIRPISTEEVTVDMITIYTKHVKNEFWLEPEELTFFATFVKKSKVKKIFFKCFYLDEDNLRENFVKAMGEEVMVDFSC
jgi:hypothetical protein